MHLLEAVKAGSVSEVRRILAEKTEDVNQTNEYGWTPLHFAAYHNNPEIIEALLADPRTLPNPAIATGSTPLHFAAMGESHRPNWKLQGEKATYGGHTEAVKALLADPRILPNQADKDGRTPLHEAIKKDRAATVKVLLADPRILPNQADKDGRTPLHTAAAKRGNTKTVKALLAAGADVHAKDNQGKTPLALHQHRWNFFLSFLAGLTLVYPLVRTVQYFWKLHNVVKRKENEVAPTTDSKQKSHDFWRSIGEGCYKSWAMYYEYGLSGEYGTKHESAEIEEAIPIEHRAALGIKLTA